VDNVYNYVYGYGNVFNLLYNTDID